MHPFCSNIRLYILILPFRARTGYVLTHMLDPHDGSHDGSHTGSLAGSHAVSLHRIMVSVSQHRIKASHSAKGSIATKISLFHTRYITEHAQETDARQRRGREEEEKG